MKPRSRRKRPRSEANDGLKIEASIVPLTLAAADPNQQQEKPSSETDDTAQTSPVLVRIIKPYPYTFTSFAKGRWVGRTVLDVYCSEFGSYPKSYYEAAIQRGQILVSGNTEDTSYIVKGKDVLSHTVHRHEPAVMVATNEAPYVSVVEERQDVIAVDKPSTLPVHSCGGYNNNSLIQLLEPTFGKLLYTIHRLDRLTSGLVIFGKTSEASKEWGEAIRQRKCDKVYLARVKGRFGKSLPDIALTCNEGKSPPVDGEWPNSKAKVPNDAEATQALEKRQANAHGFWFATTSGQVLASPNAIQDFGKCFHSVEQLLNLVEGGDTGSCDVAWFTLACPVRIADPKNGVCESGAFCELDDATYVKTVKPAQTSFAFVHYNPVDDSSLLLVRPSTGRTHQIRLHLQHLGHCIANDPNYGGELWFGDENGQQLCQEAQILLDKDDNGTKSSGLVTSDMPATEAEVVVLKSSKQRQNDESQDEFVKRTCVWCARHQQTSITERAKLEFLVRSSGLWLHALSYRVGDRSFRTQIPRWAAFPK